MEAALKKGNGLEQDRNLTLPGVEVPFPLILQRAIRCPGMPRNCRSHLGSGQWWSRTDLRKSNRIQFYAVFEGES